MIYKFIDNKGTFIVKDPHKYNLYFPLTNKEGTLLSSISPNLGGDIKKDNDHFLTPPASILDLKNNLLCRRDFFIKVDKKILRLSYPYKSILEIGFLYHKVIKRINSLYIEILNFIPFNLNVEVMQVKIINRGKPIKITPTSFIPLYGRGEKNLRDHRHVSSLLNRISLNKFGIFLKPTMVFNEEGHSINKTIYFVLGYEENSLAPLGQFPTLEYFCGKNDLLLPQAIIENIKPVNRKIKEFDGKEVCAAFRFKERVLKNKEEINYFIIMGIEENEDKIWATFKKLNFPHKVENIFEETKKYWLNYLSNLEFNFFNYNFNNWLMWVKFQPTLRKLFGCSFLPHFDYGKGGRGWRDLWQDTLTLLLTEPLKAKNLIMNNLKGIRIDGSNATIITKEGNFISDRNRISRVWMDHGVWPLLTISLYIHKSGDLNILLKETTYFKDHLVKRAKEIDKNFSQKDFLLRTKYKKLYKGSLLEHLLIQNIVPFFNVGEHNIIKLENADWNDGLDMAAKRGESVAFSFMYAHNLTVLCILLEKLKEKIKRVKILKELTILLDRINKPINYNSFKEKQKLLEVYLEKTKSISGEKLKIDIDKIIKDLKEKSIHLGNWLRKKEWLEFGFFNGYYDNKGKRVEGKFKNKTRLMLASQVFAIMSGIPTKEQIKKIFISVKKYLKDKNLGGFRLNTNFYIPHYLDLGRAFGFSYGDKENGAFFNHMVIMFAFALYKQGPIKEANEVFSSIYKMATNSKSEIYPMIPEYFNAEGKGLYFYLTGSGSWYIYTLLEEVLGIKFRFGDILIKPKFNSSLLFDRKIEVKFNIYNRILRVSYLCKKKKNTFNLKSVFLENKEIEKLNSEFIIKREELKKINSEQISIKVFLD